MNFSMILTKFFSAKLSSTKFSSTKSTNSPKHLAYSMLSRIAAIGLATCLVITGCGQTDQESSAGAVEKSSSEALSAETKATNDALQAHQQDITDSNAVTAEPEGKPVSYDVQNWKANSNTKIGVEDIDQMKNIFGKVTVTDENSLDYASNSAVKYRFMEGDQPYLDIIDSPNYLELGWYYANPNDSDEEKQISVDHAKKAYQVATALMGDEGGQLVASMLGRQITKDSEVGGKQVELAKCEFYSCMLILNKGN